MVKIKDITDHLDKGVHQYEYIGDPGIEIKTMSSLDDLEDNCICWTKNKRRMTEEVIDKIRSLKDVLLVCPMAVSGVNCIVTDYPKGVFFSILNEFFVTGFEHSISPDSTVLTDNIGDNVHIGPNCYINKYVTIGDNTIIHPNVSIISPCRIGDNCEIFPGVVIGADGFGYYYDGEVPKRETHFKGVIIGDNVDIGSNTCIDRGLISNTVIGNNVKIASLCKIGHNSHIDDNCLIISGSVICGSVHVGKNSYLAPASVVNSQVNVGEGATIGVNSVALANVREGATIIGTPGKEYLPDALQNRVNNRNK